MPKEWQTNLGFRSGLPGKKSEIPDLNEIRVPPEPKSTTEEKPNDDEPGGHPKIEKKE
jgi:hypothetical protein